ncbi:sigma-70 family RNA polymerase sigma factor [Nocardioides mangrovi]|uniref:Sigma-70 family RNA polymerase sigma factor n=1 Tax=Nocardioides mangrovi TaxID=2874580 RepID=A0ABS7UBJ5_9ACTN|nr:sigma-70 family RNA polymerase sigma factor [Nocardioides mangrovi]MBZ5738200.1 sigma-70 family RNA polymerase sigma factor [Nocardioides mangrovi]
MNDTTNERPIIDSRSEQHVALVDRVVRQVMARVPPSVDVEGLRAAGMEALELGARSYDPARGVPFARFAETRVKAAVVDRLRATDWTAHRARVQTCEIDAVDMPVARAERLAQLTDAIAELEPRHRRVIEGYFVARTPMSVLAAEIGVPEARVAQLRAEALVELREALDGGDDRDRETRPADTAHREPAYAAGHAASA